MECGDGVMAKEPDEGNFGYAGHMNQQMRRARKKALAVRPKRAAAWRGARDESHSPARGGREENQAQGRLMELGPLAAFADTCFVAATQAHGLGLRCPKCNDWTAVLEKFDTLNLPGHAYRMIWLPVERN
jgi:hypothetical protein